MEREIVFYDIECFSYDSLVIFKNLNNEVVFSKWSKGYDKFDEDNGFEELEAFIKDKTICGYNNHYYDDKMLSVMIRGMPQKAIKRFNDRLISGDPCADFKTYEFAESLDCMQQIDVSRPSLKQIEGNMGLMILESNVPFDIDRPLTEEEKAEVFYYCSYDIQTTINIYKLRKHSYFETKKQLVDMLGNPRAMKWNTTTISANILLKKPLPQWSSFQIPKRFWRNIKGVPEEVWAMWESVEAGEDASKKQCKVRTFDTDFVFGFGGLHGVAANGRTFYNVKLLDVGSMYPSIIILLMALGDATSTYDKIRKERLAIKHVDKLRSDALKLILNSVYGNLKNQYSTLYNPYASRTVCIFGQIALFDLCRMLHEQGFKIVNANTDGVAFVDEDNTTHVRTEVYEAVWHEWEEKWGLYLELDEFDKWVQKDVNNYIATHGNQVKVKGGEVNKYHFMPEKGVHKLFSNNSIRIIQIALVDKLLYNKSPLDTIIDNLDKPELFMWILKAGSTYKGVFDKEGNQVNKVNRVFAGNHRAKTTKLFKKRADGALVNFPDVPDNMIVWNDDVNKIENFDYIVDVNYYAKLVNKKLEGWMK